MRRWVCATVIAALVACCGDDHSSESRPSAGPPVHSMRELSAAGYVVIPRTNVALKPPGGFQVAEDFPTLVSDYSEITVIQERPAQPDPKKALEELEATFIS